VLCKILVFFEFPSTGNLNFGLHFVGQGITETLFLALVCLCLRNHFIMGGLVLQELFIEIVVHNCVHVVTWQTEHAKSMVS
jgi:branched-subunit amino acid transport protein AzlD